jgi:hypothetical protein
MSTATVNSIIARCILDPPFLDALTSNTEETLKGYDLDPDERRGFVGLDLSRIRYLAAFITKIQNHDVIAEIAQTHTLLRHYDLELPVFSAYRERHQRLRPANPGKREKVRAFVAFLKTYLASLPADSAPGLEDILNHEWLMWEASASAGTQRPVPGARSNHATGPARDLNDINDIDEWVPRLNGVFRVGLFEHDPVEIAGQIARSAFDSSRLCKDAGIWGYWGNPRSASVSLFRLDYGVLMVLQEITGNRSVGEIIRRITATAKSEISPEEVRSFFVTAFQNGLCITG